MQSQHIVNNRILGQLSADELKSVQPWLTPLELRSNVVLHEPGDAMERVYFPLSGMISLLAVMQSGEAIETGIVGADGLVGGNAAINGHAFGQMTVQQDGAALTMPRAKFVDAYLAHPHLRNLVDRYQAILMKQAQQNAACHALHSVRKSALPTVSMLPLYSLISTARRKSSFQFRLKRLMQRPNTLPRTDPF